MPELYVDAATGSDSNSYADAQTSTTPWLTIDHAMSNVVAGDTVWIKGGTNYNETATIVTVGTVAAPIFYKGYTTTTGDGGKATLYNSTTLTYGITSSLTSYTYNVFENLIVDNYDGSGVSATGTDALQFINCDFTNNGGYGAVVDNHNGFINCHAEGNSSIGFRMDQGALFFCSSTANSSYGAKNTDGDSLYYGCEFYANTNRELDTGVGSFVINCTVDGDGGGVGINSGTAIRRQYFINNIVYDCTTGIDAASVSFFNIGFTNLLYSNTSNYLDYDTRAQATDVYTAPTFTDEANADYTLGSGSGAINTGTDFSGTSSPGQDIGAHQSADAGGGGSRVIITG